MKPITFIFIAAASTSCVTSDKPDFTEMTQKELEGYNLTVASEDRAYCADVQRDSRGHAWRRTRYLCVTAKEIERESREAEYRQKSQDEYRPPYTPQVMPRNL